MNSISSLTKIKSKKNSRAENINRKATTSWLWIKKNGKKRRQVKNYCKLNGWKCFKGTAPHSTLIWYYLSHSTIRNVLFRAENGLLVDSNAMQWNFVRIPSDFIDFSRRGLSDVKVANRHDYNFLPKDFIAMEIYQIQLRHLLGA